MGSEGTLLDAAVEVMQYVKSEEGEMLTKPFLEVCRLHLSFIGTTTIFGSNLIVHFFN
jgi:hypothetical protein